MPAAFYFVPRFVLTLNMQHWT